MRVKLAYGKEGLWVDLPDRNVTVVEPKHVPGLPDELAAVRAALRSPLGARPLRDLVKPQDTVAIVFSDITRPQPRDRMLKVLLEEIAAVPSSQIVLINGLGTHRPNTEDELVGMLGRDIVANYRVVQHDAWDKGGMVCLGNTTSGHEVWVNGDYMRASVKILTGFIEPHFFAGFSGGPKAVLPAIVNQQAVLGNHDTAMISDPRATWGITEGNPIWEEMREVALMTCPAFLLNVTLNRDKQITGVFAGDMLQSHAEGTRFATSTAMVAVPEPFDVVIASNSGYPLDLNLYQAVKGMSAAAKAVKPGGAIIIAAECWDGVPEHGEYGKLLQMASSPEQLLAVIQAFRSVLQDQWQVQIQAQVQMQADVFIRSTYLSESTLRKAMLNACTSVERTLSELLEKYGSDATICVMPEGPMTIPYLGHSERLAT